MVVTRLQEVTVCGQEIVWHKSLCYGCVQICQCVCVCVRERSNTRQHFLQPSCRQKGWRLTFLQTTNAFTLVRI